MTTLNINFEDLMEFFRDYRHDVLIWYNSMQEGGQLMKGRYKNEPLNNNSIIFSLRASTELDPDRTTIFLTTPQYAGIGAHISIFKDSWNSNKLIHVTIYYQNYVPTECSQYYFVTVNGNDIVLMDVPTVYGEFNPTTLNRTPPFVSSMKTKCTDVIHGNKWTIGATEFYSNVGGIINNLDRRAYEVNTVFNALRTLFTTFMQEVVSFHWNRMKNEFPTLANFFISFDMSKIQYYNIAKIRVQRVKEQQLQKTQPIGIKRGREEIEGQLEVESVDPNLLKMGKTMPPENHKGGSKNLNNEYLKYKTRYIELKKMKF
jgi:UDP-2,3-diacylglucosamine pyrophosphatase LpxH